MARIKLYPNDTTVQGGDKLVGTDINGNATKNYQIEELAQYFEQSGNALFQYNFAGTYTTEVINTGEYRYQVDPSAPTIYNWAQITGIAISRYNRNGEDVTPMVPHLVNQLIRILDIGTSTSKGYGLFRIKSSEPKQSGEAFFFTLGAQGSAGLVGNDIISFQPFGGEGFEFVESFDVATATWVITHNLGRFPSVSTVDSSGNIIDGAITYKDANKITVVFTSATSGKVYLN